MRKEEVEQELYLARSKSKHRKDQRSRKLQAALDDMQMKHAQEQEPGASTREEVKTEALKSLFEGEMEQEEKDEVEAEREIQLKLDDLNNLAHRDIRSLQREYDLGSQTIRSRAQKDNVRIETEWRKKVAVWIGKANRKLEAKQKHVQNGAKKVKRRQHT